MQKFSRSLLFAGVMAFGVLTACEGDTIVQGDTGVQSISVTPPTATINVGESISLAASVTADAATAKTVTWSTSSAATATVDATGKVTGVKAGNVTITATSTADPSKAAAAAITVNAGPVVVNPSIAINSVTQGGAPANLLGAAGQLDVTVNTSGGGLIEAFLSSNCTTNTIGATETPVASQQATSAQPGTVTLSFNTAQLTATGAPRFPNAAYCIKTRLTNGATVVVATNTIPLTLANVNTVTASLAFTSRTGGPTSAVSSINGLNYNQGDLTVTITPVIFTSSSPASLISGTMTLNGELNGGPAADITFTNLAVTSGKATIVFTDTSLTGVNSIFRYTSLPAGDTLYIASATDAAGNPISLGSGVAATGAQGVRIDNDRPVLGTATFVVNAPNAYVGGAYTFSSGTTNGGTISDTNGGVPGVGGVTVTYYVGAATATGFTNANSCDVTGLTVAGTGADLANTQVTTADRAKVVIADKLGNKQCLDADVVTSSGTLTGTAATFGVDKTAPIATASTSNNGASDKTGYTVGSAKNFSFVYNDSGSAGFSTTQPLTGTLVRNFTLAASTDCQLGTYNSTAKTCTAVPITITSTFGTPPNAGGSISMTNGTAGAAGSNAYYTVTVRPVDQAGNLGPTVTRIAAYDTIAPAVAAPSVTPSPVAPLGTVTLSATATDNLDLATAKGSLVYATAPAPIAGPAATSFGTLFDATLVQSATASASISNVYRGLQSTAAGIIQANAATPTGTLTVTDVGTNSTTSAASAIPTTTAATNILQSTAVTFAIAPTSAAPSTSQTSTTLTINLSGAASDIPFQSQPFASLDIYKLVGSELVKQSTVAVTSSNYTTTANATTRFYTYVLPGVALTAASTNQFYVVAVTTAGDAVISPLAQVVNP